MQALLLSLLTSSKQGIQRRKLTNDSYLLTDTLRFMIGLYDWKKNKLLKKACTILSSAFTGRSVFCDSIKAEMEWNRLQWLFNTINTHQNLHLLICDQPQTVCFCSAISSINHTGSMQLMQKSTAKCLTLIIPCLLVIPIFTYCLHCTYAGVSTCASYLAINVQ